MTNALNLSREAAACRRMEKALDAKVQLEAQMEATFGEMFGAIEGLREVGYPGMFELNEPLAAAWAKWLAVAQLDGHTRRTLTDDELAREREDYALRLVERGQMADARTGR